VPRADRPPGTWRAAPSRRCSPTRTGIALAAARGVTAGVGEAEAHPGAARPHLTRSRRTGRPGSPWYGAAPGSRSPTRGSAPPWRRRDRRRPARPPPGPPLPPAAGTHASVPGPAAARRDGGLPRATLGGPARRGGRAGGPAAGSRGGAGGGGGGTPPRTPPGAPARRPPRGGGGLPRAPWADRHGGPARPRTRAGKRARPGAERQGAAPPRAVAVSGELGGQRMEIRSRCCASRAGTARARPSRTGPG